MDVKSPIFSDNNRRFRNAVPINGGVRYSMLELVGWQCHRKQPIEHIL